MYLIYPYDGQDIQNSYQYFKNNEDNKLTKYELHLNILFFDVSLNELKEKFKICELLKSIN